jgi:hypothetical protein
MRSHQTIRAESTSPLARALGVFLGPAAAPVRSEQEVPEFAGVGMSPLFSLSPSSSLIYATSLLCLLSACHGGCSLLRMALACFQELKFTCHIDGRREC